MQRLRGFRISLPDDVDVGVGELESGAVKLWKASKQNNCPQIENDVRTDLAEP